MATLEINNALADKIVTLAQQQQQSVDDFLATLLNTAESGASIQHHDTLVDITERKRLEAEAHIYQAAVQASTDLIIVVDREYRYTMVNDTYLRFRQLPRHALIGRHHSEFVGEEAFNTIFKPNYDRCFAGESLNIEAQIEYPLLGLRDTWATWSPLRDKYNQVVGVVSIIRDVTERKQIEDETRTYKAAVEASNDLIVVIDKHYHYLIANETYLKYHHVERQQIIGRHINTVIGQALFDAELKHRYERCFAGETQYFENTYRYPLLGTRHTFATWLPVRDETQQVTGAVVIIHDITERKQMELARRANEKKFQTLFDVLPVGISLLNHQRDIVQANPMLEKILDKPMAALLSGDSLNRRYIHGDGSPILPHEFPWEMAIHEQQPVIDVEVGIVKEDGNTIWTSLNAAPLADDDLSAVVVTRDITRRKQAETLTRQLQVEREQVKILREFISNVSHDLNTPITQIITSLYLLKRSMTADTEQRRLAKLEAYTHQIRDIVQDLIQMSELDAKENFDYIQTDMKVLLETLMMEYAPAAQHKNQHLTFNCQLDTFSLNVDEGYLRLALQNMLDNAVEYTHDGGSIILAAYHQASAYVIEIADSGIGIDEQHLPHIFERFYRVDRARPVGDGHTGMGLAIAHKIIQIHQGWIEVESRPYHGSIFRIFLPDSNTH